MLKIITKKHHQEGTHNYCDTTGKTSHINNHKMYVINVKKWLTNKLMTIYQKQTSHKEYIVPEQLSHRSLKNQ